MRIILFETVPNDDAQVDAMISVLESHSISKVGLIYTTDSYAGSLAQTFKQKWVDEKGYILSPDWDSSPSFSIGDGATNAADAIARIRDQGTAAWNLISVGETNDVEALMRAANSNGLIGNGYVWGGFDVFASTVNSGDDSVKIKHFL